jgi:hypothetical protein
MLKILTLKNTFFVDRKISNNDREIKTNNSDFS